MVSVIIPVYNGEAFLAEAVESIRCQDHEPLEIIIVDDGSTDRTSDIAQRLNGNICYVYQPNRGSAAARNEGLRLARSEMIAFLDADDLWTEGSLHARLDYLQANPEVEIVFGLTQRVYPTSEMNGRAVFEAITPPWAALAFGSALFRRRTFDCVGSLDESLRMGEDVDWCLRARERGLAMRFLKQVALIYRIHGQNLTQDAARRDRGFLRALKHSLDRRREGVPEAAADLPPLIDIDEMARELMGGVNCDEY